MRRPRGPGEAQAAHRSGPPGQSASNAGRQAPRPPDPPPRTATLPPNDPAAAVQLPVPAAKTQHTTGQSLPPARAHVHWPYLRAPDFSGIGLSQVAPVVAAHLRVGDGKASFAQILGGAHPLLNYIRQPVCQCAVLVGGFHRLTEYGGPGPVERPPVSVGVKPVVS